MTCGPPIFPSASAARLRTHQSASRIALSRYLIELSSPTTFSTSTAARRACSDSSFSISTRWRTVSGCLLRHRSSMAGFWTSSSGSRRSGATSAGSTWPLPFAMARKCRRPDQLVGIFQGPLQRGPYLGRVEARQQRNDVRACDGVLAVDPGDQFVHARGVHQLARDAEEGGLLVGILQVGGIQELAQVEAVLLGRDDVENRRLRNAGRLQQLEQQRRRIVAGGSECPGDARDRARIFLRERLGEHREGLVVDERRQCLDECDRLALVRGRERIHDRLDRVLAEALEPRQCRLRLRAGRVATFPYLGDEAIRPVASENSHPTPAVLVEPGKNAEQSVCHSTPVARPGGRLRIQCRPPTGTDTWPPARRIG